MRHAQTKPDLTLGVAAFSQSQMQVIQDELEVLRRKDSSTEPFFASHPEEPFFVKNLENVQGDERDVIFISVGYGHTQEGFLAMNFGPLNQEGGERRLNVLVSRARLRCEVFSNLTGDDLDLSRSSARGVAAFKTFLTFAQTNVLDVPRSTSEVPESPFEEAVADSIRRHGFDVRHQIGSAGFRVDLGVVDPDHPGRYLLGIECDGATYHSARWARDRDRLRQDVLEGLGWKIHRIWSTDWFRDPDRELRRTIESIERAKAEVGEPNGHRPCTNDLGVRAQEEAVRRKPASKDGRASETSTYQVARVRVYTQGRELHAVLPKTIGGWIAKVVVVEGPVHISEVASRIAAAAGVRRVGSRIRNAIDAGVSAAVRAGKIKVKGEFLWIPRMSKPPIRDRSNLPNSSRKLELIAPEEIERAVTHVVSSGVGIKRDEVRQEVCRLFGFARVTNAMQKPISKAIVRMLKDGRLKLQGDQIMVAD
jgi:very-short-patch-repair endonuclease